MDNYHGENFLDDFVQFLNKRVDCRLEAMLTEDNRTASHQDRTGELESKVEELESKVEELESELRYHEDRISELETYEDRIANLEHSLETLARFNNQEVQALVDSRIKHLVLAGDLHLSINTRHES